MSIKRKLIREKLTALLVAANIPEVGADVYASRARPIQSDELPLLAVFCRSEASEIYNSAPLRLRRTMQLVVEVCAALDADLDSKLDTIAQAVENIVSTNPTLDGLADDTIISTVAIDIVGDEAEAQMGVCALTFDCMYYAYWPEDQSANLSPFTGIDADIDLAPKDGNIDSEVTVNLPQS